jgi:hypothetical protein
MKRFSEQFKKQAEAISMSAKERNALRERLVSYMEYHPLPKEMAGKKVPVTAREVIVSEPFFAIKLNAFHVRSFAGVFAVFLILGVPVVAEQSMPGDVLYPVKVEFNEELRSTLALSPYAKVAWETQRLERRLAEARLLASEGKLTEEAETQVAAAVKGHSDAAKREIAQLRESDSDEAAIAEIAFASALAVQTEVLEGHIEKDPQTEGEGTGHSVLALASVVAEERDSAEAAQADAAPSYDKLLGKIESESTQVYELFASVKDQATKKEVNDVERRLADIERKIAQATALKEGRATQEDAAISALSLSTRTMKVSDTAETATTLSMLATNTASVTDESVLMDEVVKEESEPETAPANTEAESIALLRSALTDIQKLLSYMTHIDVRENVSIEDLLPLTLTPEERVQKVMDLLDETMALQTKIGTHELNEKLQEKVTLGQESLERQITLAVEAMEAGDIDTAYAILDEAYTLAADLDKMTDKQPLKEAPQLDQATTTTQTETE